MRSKLAESVLCLSLASSPLAVSAGDGVVWNDVNADLSHRCTSGESIKVVGTSNRVALTGDCGSLRIEGTRNRVRAERLASVDVDGVGNVIEWKGPRKNAPKVVRNVGVGNRIVRSGP